MKYCPNLKCKKSHNKPGLFCSRSCANSRKFSEVSRELKRKKTLAWLEKHGPRKLTKEERKNLAIERRKYFQSKLDTMPFSEMGLVRRKKKILQEQKNCCKLCDCDPIHNGYPLVFQLDHIDGNKQNEDRSNLRMICPNCHTQTETYAGRNMKRKPS